MQHCCSDGISLLGCSPICCCMVGYIRSNVTGHCGLQVPMHRRACQGIRCTATRADVFAVRLAQALPGAAPRYFARRRMRWLRACRIAASSKMWVHLLLTLMLGVALFSPDSYIRCRRPGGGGGG